MTNGHPIVLFDAECVLCSANAQFILRHDRARRFRLAAMQGEVGAALCRRHGIDPANSDTIIVVDGNHALRDSDAVIAIYVGLGWAGLAVARGRGGADRSAGPTRPCLSLGRATPLPDLWQASGLLVAPSRGCGSRLVTKCHASSTVEDCGFFIVGAVLWSRPI